MSAKKRLSLNHLRGIRLAHGHRHHLRSERERAGYAPQQDAELPY